MPVASRVVPIASSRRSLVSQPARDDIHRRGQHERTQPAHLGHEVPAQDQHDDEQDRRSDVPAPLHAAVHLTTRPCSAAVPAPSVDLSGSRPPVRRWACRPRTWRSSPPGRGAARRGTPPAAREHLVFASGAAACSGCPPAPSSPRRARPGWTPARRASMSSCRSGYTENWQPIAPVRVALTCIARCSRSASSSPLTSPR